MTTARAEPKPADAGSDPPKADSIIVLHDGIFRELTGPLASEILALLRQRQLEKSETT